MNASELETWPGRYKLFKRAAVINPSISIKDHDDRLGFIAACLCSRKKAEKPAAMLLSFVRRAAWRKRGYGGLDGFWMKQAQEAMRNRERERREVQELQGAR